MSTPGRTIRIFLTEGTAEGLRTAEIINWTGKLFVFARAGLADFAKRSESKRTGIYFLVGQDLDEPLKDAVYVGESDNIFARLAQHDKDSEKEFWTETVVVISKDENLTKAHVRYLESRIIQFAHDAKRSRIVNGTNPPSPPIPESDTADMETFLAQVQILLPVLGFSFTKSLPTISHKKSSTIKSPSNPQPRPAPSIEFVKRSSPSFILKFGGSPIAMAEEIDDEFVVGEGSKARTTTGAISESYRQKREQLRKDGILEDSDDTNFWIFTEDVAFNSPSAAAAVINGYNTNGRQIWKQDHTGESYQQWKDWVLKEVIPYFSVDDDDNDSSSSGRALN